MANLKAVFEDYNMAIKVTIGTLTVVGIIAGGWVTLGFPTVVLSNELSNDLQPIKEIVSYNLATNQTVINREELDILERLSRKDLDQEYRALLKTRLIKIREEKKLNEDRQRLLKELKK